MASCRLRRRPRSRTRHRARRSPLRDVRSRAPAPGDGTLALTPRGVVRDSCLARSPKGGLRLERASAVPAVPPATRLRRAPAGVRWGIGLDGRGCRIHATAAARSAPWGAGCTHRTSGKNRVGANRRVSQPIPEIRSKLTLGQALAARTAPRVREGFPSRRTAWAHGECNPRSIRNPRG